MANQNLSVQLDTSPVASGSRKQQESVIKKYYFFCIQLKKALRGFQSMVLVGVLAMPVAYAATLDGELTVKREEGEESTLTVDTLTVNAEKHLRVEGGLEVEGNSEGDFGDGNIYLKELSASSYLPVPSIEYTDDHGDHIPVVEDYSGTIKMTAVTVYAKVVKSFTDGASTGTVCGSGAGDNPDYRFANRQELTGWLAWDMLPRVDDDTTVGYHTGTLGTGDQLVVRRTGRKDKCSAGITPGYNCDGIFGPNTLGWIESESGGDRIVCIRSQS